MLDSVIRVALIRTKFSMMKGELFDRPTLPLEIASECFVQSSGRVKVCNSARQIQRMSDVVEPRHLAIRRVEEWHAKLAKAHIRGGESTRVPLRLRKNVLRSNRQLLRFNDSDRRIAGVKDVVGGAM